MATDHPVRSQPLTDSVYHFATVLPHDTNHAIGNETIDWLPVHTHIRD